MTLSFRYLWVALAVLVAIDGEALGATPAVPSLFQAAAPGDAGTHGAPGPVGVVRRARPITSRIDLLVNPDRSPRVVAGGRIGLNLFDDASFVLTVSDFTEHLAGGRSWGGALDGVDHGYAVLALQDGALVGNVFTPAAVYRIGYAPDGTQVVEQIDQSRLPREADPVIPPPSPPSDAPIPPGVADSAAQIDVMVLFTPAMRLAAGGTAAAQAEAVAAVAAANQAYTNNGLVQRLRLVVTAEVPITESGDFGTDLNGLQANVAIGALRDTNAADIVTLLTSNGPNPQLCGIGFQMSTNSTAFAPNAFNVVDRICASANLSYPHELGHNMGAAHDAYVSGPNEGLFVYSHGYVNLAGRIRTIMAYDDQCEASGFVCTRIPYFSTPSQTYTGQLIGTAATSDNARTLGLTGDTVANFRTGNSATFTYSMSSSGDVVVAQGGSVVTTVNATLLGGAATPVTFSVSGLPSGATASFSPAACTPSCSAELTIAVSGSVAPGTFALIVSGTPGPASTGFNLVVEPGFDYALTDARGITVPQGGIGATTMTVALLGARPQTVNFAASGLPAGAIAAFTPEACNPTCSTTLTIVTSGVTPVGTFPITVTGTPLGKTTSLTLVVTPYADGVSAFVIGLYQNVLARIADAGELSYWTDLLHQQCDVATVRNTVDAFFDSVEFRARPLTLGALVGTIYRSLLLREPDPPALTFWTSVLREDRRALALTFVGSSEFQALLPDRTNRAAVTTLVARLYAVLLARAPDDRELSSWVNNVVATRNVEGMVSVFVTSAEFEQRALTFRDYAALLYRSILGRDGGDAELDGKEAVLRSRLLGVIDGSFIASAEFQARIPRICAAP